MKKVLLLVLSIVALVSALMLGTTAVASAGTTQFWYLDTATGVSGLNQMERDTGGVITAGGQVNIAAHGSTVWVADEPAGTDVTFPNGSWLVSLSTNSNWSTNVDVLFGRYDSVTGVYFWFPTLPGEPGYIRSYRTVEDTKIVDVNAPAASETVNRGDYLVVKVFNKDSVSHPVYLDDGVSYVRSPGSDPGYPLAEMAAGILLGGGLIGLVSYVAIRRRQAQIIH